MHGGPSGFSCSQQGKHFHSPDFVVLTDPFLPSFSIDRGRRCTTGPTLHFSQISAREFQDFVHISGNLKMLVTAKVLGVETPNLHTMKLNDLPFEWHQENKYTAESKGVIRGFLKTPENGRIDCFLWLISKRLILTLRSLRSYGENEHVLCEKRREAV